MFLRAILAMLFVLTAGALVARSAAVSAFAEEQPELAERFWPDHPDVLRSVAMARVGEAAGAGKLPPFEAMRGLEQLARNEPLSVQPFLVRAAIAQQSGDLAEAQRLLVHARDRAPRSAAARFLLADVHFRSGRILPGLVELAVLGRLVPGGPQQVAPALAAFAQRPGAAGQLKQIVRTYPEFEPVLLNQLAADPANASLILEIAGISTSSKPQRWQKTLLSGLVSQGEFEQAHAVWARLAGVPRASNRGLFNADFRPSHAPAPFNWTFESSGEGVAEPANGALRVIYYGRADSRLASQTMLLQPGRYALAMSLAGEVGQDARLAWVISCLPGGVELLRLQLPGGQQNEAVAGQFEVPAEGCRAQELQLMGAGTEFPQPADFQISDLDLRRVGS